MIQLYTHKTQDHQPTKLAAKYFSKMHNPIRNKNANESLTIIIVNHQVLKSLEFAKTLLLRVQVNRCSHASGGRLVHV